MFMFSLYLDFYLKLLYLVLLLLNIVKSVNVIVELPLWKTFYFDISYYFEILIILR